MNSPNVTTSAREARITDLLLADRSWVKEPQLVREFCSNPSWILSRVDQILRGFGSQAEAPAFRLFVENGNRTDLGTSLRRSPMGRGEAFHQWVPRVIGRNEYCLAFNGVTAWDDTLAAYIVENIVRPIVDIMGTPTRGFDVYLFAGCYKLTPFGVHRDREPSILLHLGPAPKPTMVWRSQNFPVPLRPDQEINEFDIEKFETSATHLKLQPGDLLFIPARAPHVMRSERFSVTLGIIPNIVDEKGAIVECIRELADLHGGFSSDASFLRNSAELARRASQLHATEDSATQSLVGAVQSIEKRLASNGYLVPPPVERSSRNCQSHFFRVPDDYPIFVTEDGGAITIYARGRFARMRFDPLLFKWLSINLVQGCVFDKRDVSRNLGQRLEETAISSLFDILVRLRALFPMEK